MCLLVLFDKREVRSRVFLITQEGHLFWVVIEDFGLIFENCKSPGKDFSKMKFKYVMCGNMYPYTVTDDRV
jgi:hypothetical protein